MDFRETESFDPPVLEDTKSSPHGVYIRRNLREEEYTPEEGDPKTLYRYEEAFISFAEYSSYQLNKLAIDQSEQKRESEIIDDYTLSLIDEGVIG